MPHQTQLWKVAESWNSRNIEHTSCGGREGDTVHQELMDLGMERWVEFQLKNDRENFRRRLPATRAEPRNPKDFSVICATRLDHHLMMFFWLRTCLL